MKDKRAPVNDEKIIHHYHQAAPHTDHSSSGSWILGGFAFAILAIPLGLLIDISSPNSGGRAIAALKGFLVAVVVVVLFVFLSGCTALQTREQRNFEKLCDQPLVICIETEDGWQFRGPQHLLDEICQTENTGITCES